MSELVGFALAVVVQLVQLVQLAQLAAPGGPGRVAVSSDTACPAAADVEARLAALLPPLAAGAAPERAEVTAVGDAVRVHLAGSDGVALGDRTLTLAASCADRANVVAVVIAAWEAQRAREDVAAPMLPHAAPPPEPPTVVAAAPPPAPPPAVVFELSVGPAVTWLDGSAAPAGALTLAAWGRLVGGRVGLLGFWPLTDGLGVGHARWSRVGASFEGGVRARTRAGRFDAHAGAVAAVLVASGAGFDRDQSVSGLSPGVTAGGDWSYAFGRAFVGVGASAVGWTAQRLVSSVDAHALPRWQLSFDAHAGVAF